MTITPFGLIFLPIVAGILAFRRDWLIQLLIVSACLHIPAVAVIGPNKPGVGIGITPWLVVTFAIFLHLIWIVSENRNVAFGETREVRWIFTLWTLFSAWGVISAFTLPWIFEGLPVLTLANFGGFDTDPVPLRWHFVNAVQAINLAIIWLMMLYGLQISKAATQERRIYSGFVLAAIISSALAIYQFLHGIGLTSPLYLIDSSINPSYNLGYDLGVVSQINGFPRACWPFSEYSYASVWFSGIVIGGLSVYFLSKHIYTGLALSLMGSLALMMSTGSTGLAGTATGLIILVISTLAIMATNGIKYKQLVVLKLIALIAFVSISSFGLINQLPYQYKEQISNYRDTLTSSIHKRINDTIYGTTKNGPWRNASNTRAISVAQETHWLGAGAGSNRASSYLLSMLSNMGALGVILFIYAIAKLLGVLISRAVPPPAHLLIIFGIAAILPGMIFGIPDQNWPGFWIWVIAGMALLNRRTAHA